MTSSTPFKSVNEHVDEFLETYLKQWFAKGGELPPLFIFISGPQGSGKSYTSEHVYQWLQSHYGDSKTVARASIDDFYWTYREQQRLNSLYKKNKLLQGRGLPGTHDMGLLYDCMSAVLQKRGNREDYQILELPVYDKSSHNGEGDRSTTTRKIKPPVDIFILEGWFLGFEPVLCGDNEDDLGKMPMPLNMEEINGKLFQYSDLLWCNPEVKSLGIVFDVDEITNVYMWRIEQEHALIQERGTGKTDQEVHTFVNKYMPCYRSYYEPMVHGEKLGSVANLTLGIDIHRRVYSIKTRSIE